MQIQNPFENGYIKKFKIFFSILLIFVTIFFILTKIYYKPKKIEKENINDIELHTIVKNKRQKKENKTKFELLNNSF